MALFRAAESGQVVVGGKHASNLGRSQIRPVISKVVRAKVFARDLPLRQSLNGNAVLGCEPAFASRPVRDVAHIRVSQRPSHSGVRAKELNNPGGGLRSLGDVGFRFHRRKSNLICSRHQIRLDGADER